MGECDCLVNAECLFCVSEVGKDDGHNYFCDHVYQLVLLQTLIFSEIIDTRATTKH